jgi:hypothetical protein
MGRHSKGHQTQQRRTIATVELVDVSGTAHRDTVDAAAEGLPRGRYTTICGGEVLPGALVAEQARYCRLCIPVLHPRGVSS